MVALARAEGERMLRHPIFVGGLLMSVTVFVLATWERAPVLHRDDILMAATLLPLAAATLVVANLAALRSRRHGTDELYDSVSATLNTRTAAHLLSVAWAVSASVVVILADLTYFLLHDPVGTPSLFELLTGPAIVALCGVIGVLLARWAPVVMAGPVAVVALAAAQLFLHARLAGLFERPNPARWLVLWVPISSSLTTSETAALLVIRPARWHLLYLAGMAATVAVLALLGHPARPRIVAIGSAALALTIVAGGLQVRAPTAAQEAGLAFLLEHPDQVRVCRLVEGVRLCAYPAYEPWIDRWAGVVGSVLEGAPSEAKPDGLAVLQVLPRIGADVPRDVQVRLERAEAEAADRSILTDTSWGWGGTGDGFELGLGLATSARVIGLPIRAGDIVLTEEDIAAMQSQFEFGFGDHLAPGQTWGACHLVGQARAVVALWLAARTTPGAGAELRRLLGRSPYGTQVIREGHMMSVAYNGPFVYEVNNLPFGRYTVADIASLGWGIAETYQAVRLLDRPDTQVAAVLARDWDRLTHPSATTEDLVEAFGMDPMPTLAEQLAAAGQDPSLAAGIPDDSEYIYDPPCR